MAQVRHATRAGLDPVAPESPPSLARYGRPPAVKWAIRPTRSALDGAARPLLLGSSPAQTGFTAPPPGRDCEPMGQTWDGCEEHVQSTSARAKRHPDRAGPW